MHYTFILNYNYNMHACYHANKPTHSKLHVHQTYTQCLKKGYHLITNDNFNNS